jgi:hypothetical protein
LYETNYRPAVDVNQLSLAQTVRGHDPERGQVFVEAYPPNNFLSTMKKHSPQLIETFYCNLRRWAAFQGQYKLVRVEDKQAELFDLATDPLEEKNVIDQHPELAASLAASLKTFVSLAIQQQPDSWTNQTLNLEEDENVSRHLRALGYID